MPSSTPTLRRLVLENCVAAPYAAPGGIGYAEAIGWAHAFTKGIGARRLAICGDGRPSTPSIMEAATLGARLAGAHVYDLGLYTTELLSDHMAGQDLDAGIMVTAGSAEDGWTGLKFFGPEGRALQPKLMEYVAHMNKQPIPEDTALAPVTPVETRSLYHIALSRRLAPYGAWPVQPDQGDFIVILDGGLSYAAEAYEAIMARLPVPACVKLVHLESVGLGVKTSNPTAPRRLMAMSDCIKRVGAKIGLSWDSGAEQLVAFDETGAPIPGAVLGAIIGNAVAHRYPEGVLMTDQRWVFPMATITQDLKRKIGIAMPGDVIMRQGMWDQAAIYGCDAAGYHYFSDTNWTASSQMAAVLLTMTAFLTPTPIGQIINSLCQATPLMGEFQFQADDPVRLVKFLSTRMRADLPTAMVGAELVGMGKVNDNSFRFCLRPDPIELDMVLLTTECGPDQGTAEETTKDILRHLQSAMSQYHTQGAAS